MEKKELTVEELKDIASGKVNSNIGICITIVTILTLEAAGMTLADAHRLGITVAEK